MGEASWDSASRISAFNEVKRSDFRLWAVDYSGATVPEFHQLLYSLQQLPLTLWVAGMGVKAFHAGVLALRWRERWREMTSRVTWISHAETPALRRAAFPLDETLEAATLDKLTLLRWNAPKAQQILSAPEQRAQMTARRLNLAASVAEDLRDCDFGCWRGREFLEVHRDDPDGIASWLTDPAAAPHGGESIAALVDRVARWLTQHSAEGHTIAVTHPAIIRGAIIFALDAPLQSFWRVDISPASVTDLRFNGSAWTIRSLGERLECAC